MVKAINCIDYLSPNTTPIAKNADISAGAIINVQYFLGSETFAPWPRGWILFLTTPPVDFLFCQETQSGFIYFSYWFLYCLTFLFISLNLHSYYFNHKGQAFDFYRASIQDSE